MNKKKTKPSGQEYQIKPSKMDTDTSESIKSMSRSTNRISRPPIAHSSSENPDESRSYYYTQIRDYLNSHRDLGYPEIYSSLWSDEDRIKLAIALLAEHNLLGPQSLKNTSDCLEKHLGISQDQGCVAERLMRQHKLNKKEKLLEICTKAIIYAPVDSKELAVAYGRRAEALLRAELYEDSIKDVERGFQSMYPPHLQAKLSLIKTKALVAMYDRTSPIVLKSIEETRDYTKLMDSSKRGPITGALNRIIKDSSRHCSNPVIKWDDGGYLREFGAGNVKNLEVPGASDAIAIRYSGKYGRHIVATRDIEVGELLAVQLPYAAVVELDRRFNNCWYCSMQTWAGVPCENCVHVIYCSYECRNKAWEEFHDVECAILGLMIVEKFDVTAVMTVRLLVKAWKEAGGWERLKEKIEEIESNSDCRTKGFTGGILDSTKYSSVYTLAKCTEKRSMEDLFRLSVGTATVVHMLATMTNIFGEKLSGEQDVLLRHPWVVFAGSLLLKHAQIHAINSQMSCEWDPKRSTSWAREMALIPLYGLINQSCNPSVTYSSHGRFMALHSISPIKRGEQIFDHRGAWFAEHSLEERQLQRKNQFFFICDCLPCKENWPLLENLPSYEQMDLPQFVKKKLNTIMCEHSVLAILKSHPPTTISSVTSISILTIFEHLQELYKHVQQPCRELEEMKRTLEKIHVQTGSRCQSLDD